MISRFRILLSFTYFSIEFIYKIDYGYKNDNNKNLP